MRSQRGQSTVEWVGLVALVCFALVAMLAAGLRLPGLALGRSIAERLICAASVGEGCAEEPDLRAAYGEEVARLVREYAPTLVFERGSRALPVDFRRCRESACGDGPINGLVERSDAGLPATAFVHVVDCRERDEQAAEADCSGERAGALYIQFWTYYVDSATLRDVPVVGEEGFHRDDWESVGVRLRPGGRIAARASSHAGYNHEAGIANWVSDAGLGPLRDAAEALGARPSNGWGGDTGVVHVSGGSHAGNLGSLAGSQRFIPGRRLRLVPLEPIAALDRYRFAVSAPWRKRVWRDPEATGTG